MNAPGGGEAEHARGMAAYRAGRLERALEHLRAAARAEPSNPEYVGALAAALLADGAHEPAARCYIHMLSQDPLLADAHFGLASARQAQGDLDNATASIWRALRLRSDYAPARIMLANLLRARGHDLAAAREEMRAATGDGASAAPANIAQRRQGEAEASRQLSLALAAAGEFSDAEGEILRAAIFDADESRDMAALADIYERQGRLEDAAGALREALRAKHSNAAAHTALGGILARLGELDAAEATLVCALAYVPETAPAHLNLANIDMERGRPDKSLKHLERALKARPDYVQAHNNRANILLLQGRYGEGWDEYEWRRRMPRGAPPKLDIADWCGQPLDGRRLYIIGEQAAGDAIMFATCLGELAGADGPVSLHCEARITGLMRRAFPWLEVSERLPDDGDPAVRAGQTICLGSLPGLYRRCEADFARSRPYLSADPALVAEWRERYRALGDGIKVGFSWSGGKSHIQRRQRGMRLGDWMALFSQAGAQFVDLQFGDHDAARDELRQRFGVTPYRPAASAPGADMDSFAAQIEALDLVISIDNTTVHFAGALGVPVWTLVPTSPSWRWQSGRPDSPWYPTMTLLRRAGHEDWNAVLERAGAALAAHIRGAANFMSGEAEKMAGRQNLPPLTPCSGKILPHVVLPGSAANTGNPQ